MNAPHIAGRRTGQPPQRIGNPHRPVAGRKIHPNIIGIISPHRAVVGGNNVPLRRVDAARQLRKGYPALPLVTPVPARNRQRRRRIPRTPGNLPPTLVADIAVNVRHQQIIHRIHPAGHSIRQLRHAARLQHRRQDVRPGIAAVRRRVAQRNPPAADRVAGHHRPVMRRPGADDRIIPAARLNHLIPHLRQPPVAAGPIQRRVGIVELLQIQILVIAVGVRNRPCHPPVMPKVRKARHAGKRHPNHIKAVARQMILIIDARRIQPPMAVPGQYRPAGSGMLPGNNPRVGTAVRLSDSVELGGLRQHLRQPVGSGAVIMRPRRHDNRLPRRVGWKQRRRPFRPQRRHQPGAPGFALKHPHKDVPHLVNRQAVPGLPGFGRNPDDGVLGGQRRRAADKSVDAGGISVQHRPSPDAGGGIIGARRILQPQPPHLPILPDGGCPHDLGPASHGAPPVVLHSPQPILRCSKPLGKPGILLVAGPNVRNAPFVPPNPNLAAQPSHRNHPVQRRRRRTQLGGIRNGDRRNCSSGNGSVSIHNQHTSIPPPAGGRKYGIGQ